MDIKANTTSQATGYYDLNFEATGSYVSVTDFIYDIENDSSLGFKIEGFKMAPGGNGVKATFICTNIAINIDPSAIAKPKDDNQNDENSENGGEKTTDRQNGEASQKTEELIQETNAENSNSQMNEE